MLSVIMLSVNMLSVDMLSVFMMSVVMLNGIMLSVVMVNVDMLRVVMLSVVMLNVIMLSIVMVNVDMLSVVMLNVVMFNAVMLSVVAPFIQASLMCVSLDRSLPITCGNISSSSHTNKHKKKLFRCKHGSLFRFGVGDGDEKRFITSVLVRHRPLRRGFRQVHLPQHLEIRNQGDDPEDQVSML